MLPTHVPPVNGRGADVPAASPTPVAVGLMAPSGSHIGAGAEQRLLDVDVPAVVHCLAPAASSARSTSTRRPNRA